MQIVRIRAADVGLAQQTFAMMAVVFEDAPAAPPSREYVAGLLNRDDLWVYAAVLDGQPVGGLTAFALPLTRTEATELLVYDIAVRADQRRRGIGQALLQRLLTEGAAAGIQEMWVPADNDDQHALDFYRSAGGAAQPVTIFTFPTDG